MVPSLLIAVAIGGTAWQRARTATDTYTLLIEAAARLHTADLARSLGIDHAGPNRCSMRKDLKETPEAVRSATESLAGNAAHLARLLRDHRYPAA